MRPRAKRAKARISRRNANSRLDAPPYWRGIPAITEAPGYRPPAASPRASSLFIAECKFWRGKKGYIDTINQLLSYLTWRNSKAAVVLFVRNKDFSSVITAAKEATETHPNFIKFVNEQDETWLNYIFHINDNPSREMKLAVLLFPVPSSEGEEGMNE